MCLKEGICLLGLAPSYLLCSLEERLQLGRYSQIFTPKQLTARWSLRRSDWEIIFVKLKSKDTDVLRDSSPSIETAMDQEVSSASSGLHWCGPTGHFLSWQLFLCVCRISLPLSVVQCLRMTPPTAKTKPLNNKSLWNNRVHRQSMSVL